MFQLNKKKIIIGILIWVLAITSVIAFSLIKNNKEVSKEEKSIEKKENPYKVTMMYQYDENDIEVNTISVNNSYYYDQISGLKDENLQKKINESIKNKSDNIYETIKKNKNTYLRANVTFNYSGILSVSIFGTCEYKENKYKEYYDNVNINLSTGDELKIEDLFYEMQRFYTDYSKSAAYVISTEQAYEDQGSKLNPNKVADMEDKIFKYVNEIKKGNYTFSIDEDNISIQVDNYNVDMHLKEYLDNIVYLKKYIPTKELFIKDIGRKKIYLFSHYPHKYDYYNVKEVSDNIFLDIHLSFYDVRTSSDRDYILKYSKIDKNTDDIINKSINDKFNLITGSGYAFYNEDYNLYTLSYTYSSCNSDLRNKNTMLNIMIDSKDEKREFFDNIVYFDNKNIKCKDYNFHTVLNSKGIITIDNLFKKDYDYKSIIKEEYINSSINYDGITFEEATSRWNSKKISLYFDGNGIEVNYNGNYITTVELDKFDKSFIAI